MISAKSRGAFALLAICLLAITGRSGHGAEAVDGTHAVILLYHHVSNDTPAATSISPRMFASHLDYLADHDYQVLPLDKIVTAIKSGVPLPSRAVALTFDDGYRSILSEAAPRLEERGWPFTVFVSTDAIDEGYAGFLTWDELRSIEDAGGTIANHSKTHGHMVRRQPGESDGAWRRRIIRDIESAAERLNAELDRPARWFAWPYGEFDTDLESLVESLDLTAFGQQSGPVGRNSGLQQLPRFPMAADFATLDSLAEKLRSRPLPVRTIAPASHVLATPATAPTLLLRIPAGPWRVDDLRCYVSGQQPAHIERDENEFRITARAPLRPGRGKFNCTAPSKTEGGVYYWYSHLWIQPRDDGSWYSE